MTTTQPMTSTTSGKVSGVLRQGRNAAVFQSKERKKGESGLQIEAEENEGRIGRNETITEGRCDATERGEERAQRGEERAERDQRVKGGARRLVKVEGS